MDGYRGMSGYWNEYGTYNTYDRCSRHTAAPWEPIGLKVACYKKTQITIITSKLVTCLQVLIYIKIYECISGR